MTTARTPELIGYKGLNSRIGRRSISPHVRIRLDFYPQDKDPVFSGRKTSRRVVSFERGQSEATLLDLTWQKSIGSASGQWTAMIKRDPGVSSLDLRQGDVMGGDWVACTVIRNGVEIPLFRGVVDTVREARTSVDGATVSAWNLQGRDHGAPFEVPIAWASLYVQNVGQLVKGLHTQAVKGEVGGRPDRLFEILIEATFKRGEAGVKNKSTWALPSSLESEIGKEIYHEALSIKTGTLRGSYYNELQLWTQAGQDLWTTLGTWCNPLLNEYWLDLANISPDDGEMEAVIRERPFICTEQGMESPWFSLGEWKIPSWLIDTYDIGRGDLERFNLFEVTADFQFENAQEQTALASPLIDERSIVRHGIRPYQQSTKYIAQGNKQQGAWSEELKRWMRLLVDWHAPNPYWLNGTIRAGTALPEVRIGNLLVLDTGAKETSETFYVEGVGLNWRYSQNGPRCQSQWTLTRGYRGTGREALKMVQAISDRFKGLF